MSYQNSLEIVNKINDRATDILLWCILLGIPEAIYAGVVGTCVDDPGPIWAAPIFLWLAILVLSATVAAVADYARNQIVGKIKEEKEEEE